MKRLHLTAEEIKAITGRVKYKCQIRHFREVLQIEAVPDADGRPIVLRAAYEARMGAPIHSQTPRRKGGAPNWAALDAQKKTA